MVRSRRQSEMEENEAVAQTQVVSSNAQGFHGSQDVKKLRLSGGFDYSRLNLERRSKENKDTVLGCKQISVQVQDSLVTTILAPSRSPIISLPVSLPPPCSRQNNRL